MATEVFPNARIGFYPGSYRANGTPASHSITFTLPGSCKSIQDGDKLRLVSADPHKIVLRKVGPDALGVTVRAQHRVNGFVLVSQVSGIKAGTCGPDFAQSDTTARCEGDLLTFDVPQGSSRTPHRKHVVRRDKGQHKYEYVDAPVQMPTLPRLGEGLAQLQPNPPSPFEAQRPQAATFKPNGACTVLVEVDGEVHRFEVPLGKLLGVFSEWAAFKR